MAEARTVLEKPPRERLLEAAGRLFYRRGIHAVGIDEIIAEAGVAKMSLYRSFASKDELVAAYLEEHDARYWRWWDEAAARHPQPRALLRALLRDLADYATKPRWRGCPFTNAAVEFPERDHPARKVADANKHKLLERLHALAAAIGARDPSALADQLALLFEGAYASAPTFGPNGPATAVVAAAEALVDAQLK